MAQDQPMLEHARLHIAGWTAAAKGWTRAVSDEAGSPLGFIRFTGRTKASWFSWLRGTRLEVYETDDASHLMTLVRSWGMTRIWDVYDADDQHIGSVYLSSLVDATGERRGYIDVERIVDPSRQTLATFRKPAPS